MFYIQYSNIIVGEEVPLFLSSTESGYFQHTEEKLHDPGTSSQVAQPTFQQHLWVLCSQMDASNVQWQLIKKLHQLGKTDLHPDLQYGQSSHQVQLPAHSPFRSSHALTFVWTHPGPPR